MGEAKGKIWTVAFARLFGLRFVSTMVYYLLNTTLATIVYTLYSADAWQAGMVIGAYMLGMVLGRLFLTRYADVIGRKRIMVLAAGASALFMLSYFIQASIGFFIGFRLIHGVAQGLFSNVMTTVGIALVTGSGRHSEGVATYSLAVSLATAVGPFIGTELLARYSYQGVFIFAVVVMVAVFFAMLVMPIDELSLTDAQRKDLLEAKGIDQYIDVRALPVSFAIGFTSNAGYIIITTFLATFALEQGLEAFSSAYFALYAVSLVVFRPLAGGFMDRYGDRNVMLFSFAMNVAGLVVLACSTNMWMLFAAAILNSLGQGCLFTGGQSIVTRGVDPLRLGVVSSTYYIIADIGFTVGPVLFGLLVPLVGYSGMYLAGGAMIAVAGIVYGCVSAKRQRRGCGADDAPKQV